jgi:hypothetical protein
MKNEETSLKITRENLERVMEEIAEQQKALADSVSEAKKDFNNNLTSAVAIKKMFK